MQFPLPITPKDLSSSCSGVPAFLPFQPQNAQVVPPFFPSDCLLTYISFYGFHTWGRGEAEQFVLDLDVFSLLAEPVLGGRPVCLFHLDAPNLILGRNFQ